MVNRLISADENNNVPDSLNIRDVNLPDRLQDTALNATFAPVDAVQKIDANGTETPATFAVRLDANGDVDALVLNGVDL